MSFLFRVSALEIRSVAWISGKGCLLDASLRRCFGDVHLGGDPRNVGVLSVGWPGYARNMEHIKTNLTVTLKIIGETTAQKEPMHGQEEQANPT